MSTGPGFYKSSGDGLEPLFAPNRVDAPGMSLQASTQASNTYPINGWYWRGDEAAASITLSLPSPIVRFIVRRLRREFPNLPLMVCNAMANRLLALLPNFTEED